ncbi:MAG TPA: hypothetical protein V6C78_01385 [Crinalium sp.]|jgi:hypothetical protein
MNVKTDESILKLVSAAIRRKSMDYDSWQYTKFWGDLEPQTQQLLSDRCIFEAGELPILVVMVDPENWSVFSSRFIHYSYEGIKSKISIREIEELHFGNFRGYSKSVDLMSIRMKDEAVHSVIYEVGKPSMGAIYAAQTLQQVCTKGC